MPFTFDYPVLVVAVEKHDGVEPMMCQLPDGSLGAAVFTEELLATRCRDAWKKNAVIGELDKPALNEYLQFAAQILGAKYASFDPHPSDEGKSANILIADILSGTSGNEDTFMRS